jgi:lysophospholipase L1-like esterase
MNTRHFLAACLAISLTASQALAADARWIGAWGFAPTPPAPPPPAGATNPAPAPQPAAPAPATTPPAVPNGPGKVANVTLRQLVRVSASGKAVRLRLSNEFGAAPMILGKVMVAPLAADGSAGPGKLVTFGGETRAEIQPGAPLFSDPIALPVTKLQELAVSLYLPEETRLPSHGIRQTMSEAGDFTAAARFGDKALRMGAIVTGVQVETTTVSPVLVAIGDSITEGAGSTPGAYQSWPDLLAQRLEGRVAVVNVGISGNRLLRERSGQSTLARFDRDVLAVPGVTEVILLEGINDITRQFNPQYGERANAADLIAGYRQLIARAHAQGLKIRIGTITPLGGSRYYSDEVEAIRQQTNVWIRAGVGFDGVIDFDAAVRDPAKPSAMREAFQSGDWLHPSDAGYQAMAAAIDLKRLGAR